MDIEGRRRSDKFEDRGTGGGGGGGGGIPVRLLASLVQRLGIGGTLAIGAVLGIGYFIAPAGLRDAVVQSLTGSTPSTPQGSAAEGVCQSSPANGKACDFSRVVLASTEDVWHAQFREGSLPRYGAPPPSAYEDPTLVVYSTGVATGGCGNASSDVGPFYCPADRKLYIDPSFYGVMERRLHAPGDFAQAYVIAHEVGHHVQNLIGANQIHPKGDSANQTSVRLELQADCFAGAWGHTARASLAITDDDLREALNAAHQIGDDTLGNGDAKNFTHGSSAQRMRWFRRGFDTGDARQCDTFAVASP